MRAKSLRFSSAVRPLNSRLDKMIASYAATASAVGVALLAAAQPADAKVVYTQARVSIGGRYNLDLNHDGIVDFGVGFCSCQPEGTALTVSSNRNVGNMAIEQPGFSYGAAALMSGAPIGPKQVFKTVYGGGAMSMAFVGSYSGKQFSERAMAGSHGALSGAEIYDQRPSPLRLGTDDGRKKAQSCRADRVCVRDDSEQTTEGWPDFRSGGGRSRTSGNIR